MRLITPTSKLSTLCVYQLQTGVARGVARSSSVLSAKFARSITTSNITWRFNGHMTEEVTPLVLHQQLVHDRKYNLYAVKTNIDSKPC